MSNLSVFEFDTQEIEIVLVDENPWFNASQVAKALGYTNPPEAIADNVSAKYSQQLYLGRRGKKPVFINEPGLYQLIMRSSLPSAERFQDWVFEDVLPKIRKTGSYKIESANEPQQPAISPELEVAREIHEIYELAEKNPRIAQLLVDSRVNRFLGQAALPGAVEVWKGAVEIAEDLGYKTNHRNRGSLGKHVKALVGHLAQEEERLCNGTNRPISLYPDTEEVRDAVASFFEEEQQAS